MPWHLRCPHCGTTNGAADAEATAQMLCVGCGAPLQVSAADAATGAWSGAVPAPRRATPLLWQWIGVAGAAVLLMGFAFLAMNVRFTAPIEKQCRNNLQEIYLALQSYRTDAGCLPPRVVYDDQGQPLHSWRVLLLPYLGGDHIVERYRFDEPWNSAHNRQLADEMPSVFGCPASPEHHRFHTSYVAVVREDLTFDGQRAAPDAQPDATALIVVEIAPSEVHWMAPDDLSSNGLARPANDPEGNSVSSFHSQKVHVLAANGTVHVVKDGESISSATPVR